MKISYLDIIRVHEALHDPTCQSLEVGDVTLRIDRFNSMQRKFAITSYGEHTFVTQNMRKYSNWTSWVKMNPTRKLTWITRRHGRGYTGRVEQEVKGKLETIKIIKFHPTEHVVYTQERPIR